MDSHLDRDAQHPFRDNFLRELEQRASKIKMLGQSKITGGADGEEVLAEWKANGVGIRQLPPDEQGILRISIGGGNTPVPLNYCVFRGSHAACVDLLRKALKALENPVEVQ